MSFQPILPRSEVPPLKVPLAGGGTFDLATAGGDGGERFTMVVFYRGLHCPKCRDHLQALLKAKDDFAAHGTAILALSMDDAERAARTVTEWKLEGLPLGYGITADQARAWGLFLSSGRGVTSVGIEETKVFNEPGLFLVNADGSLFASWVQTVPFARPPVDQLLSMVAFVQEKDYPERGILEAA